MKTRRLKSWWRKDAAVWHEARGLGVITNFVGCPSGSANVYFYSIDGVLNDVPRTALRRAPKT